MTQDAALAILIGAFLPPVFSIVMRQSWSSSTQANVSLVLCLGVAVAASFLTDSVRLNDPSFDWVIWGAGIYGAAQVTYGRYWKPTDISPRIEQRVNP